MSEGGSPSHHRRKLIRKILSYLCTYADAKDTIEGIARWWLRDYEDSCTTLEIQEALNWLMSREWLTVRETTPSQKIYGLNMDRFEEVQQFLQGLDSDKKPRGLDL